MFFSSSRIAKKLFYQLVTHGTFITYTLIYHFISLLGNSNNNDTLSNLDKQQNILHDLLVY